MSTSITWNDLINKLKGVANRGTLNWSGSNTTCTVSAGYYTGGTLDSRSSYNNGRTQGRNDVKNSPNSYGLYTKSQYDANWNSGRSQGQTDVKNSPNSYGLYTKSQYDSNWSNGYNSGRGNIRVVTGSVVSSSTENVNYSGGYKNRAVVAFNPGGNPLMAYARRQWDNHAVFHASNGTFYISSSSIWDVSSGHDFNSSSVHLPTDTSGTDKTWSYWCAIY